MNNYEMRKSKFKRVRNDFRKYVCRHTRMYLESLKDKQIAPDLYMSPYIQKLHSFKHIAPVYHKDFKNPFKEIMKFRTEILLNS